MLLKVLNLYIDSIAGPANIIGTDRIMKLIRPTVLKLKKVLAKTNVRLLIGSLHVQFQAKSKQ